MSSTRGPEVNRLYVDTRFDPDPDTGHHGASRRETARQVLESVLTNERSNLSAHEAAQRAGDDPVFRVSPSRSHFDQAAGPPVGHQAIPGL